MVVFWKGNVLNMTFSQLQYNFMLNCPGACNSLVACRECKIIVNSNLIFGKQPDLYIASLGSFYNSVCLLTCFNTCTVMYDQEWCMYKEI